MTVGITGLREDRPLVPAMGGARMVPSPDPIATEYLLLALRLDQRTPGLVDGYFGPATLKAQVDMEQLRAPGRLRQDAADLRQRLALDVPEPDRRAWLEAQLVALEAQAAVLAGEDLSYQDLVECTMGFAPQWRDDDGLRAARDVIDELLPGDEPLADRLAAWDRALVIPVDRIEAVCTWLVDLFRGRATRAFGLPAGDSLRVGLVTGQPWSGYCWFDGGRSSRVDINTDLPVRAPDLIRTIAHETYPGHHLEHAWKETELVDRLGRLESSVLLINTPECTISEGLADLGVSFAVPAEKEADLIEETIDRAGLPVAADRGAVRAVAERAAALRPARRALSAVSGNAAYLRHADGLGRDAVLAYLREIGGYDAASAAKRLDFIDHPLWRTYVFVYAEGERLLRQWVEDAPPGERTARFGRLLHEQVTPATIIAGSDAGRAPG